MKTAILLPGYLDSPDYLHFKLFEKRLQLLGYKVIRLDPCRMWKTGKIQDYSVTNYIKDVEDTVKEEVDNGSEEIILIGHSLGGFISILVGSKLHQVRKIIALCPPANYKSNHQKWINGVRISKRQLPNNLTKFKIYTVPDSFLTDAQKYSAIEAIRTIKKPLMIFIALDDKVVLPKVTEQLVSAAIDPYVVRKEGISHDFRKSEDQGTIVMDEIEKFLSTFE